MRARRPRPTLTAKERMKCVSDSSGMLRRASIRESENCSIHAGRTDGITFPAANVVEVQLASPDDHEGPAKGRTGVCIKNTLEQIGLLDRSLEK